MKTLIKISLAFLVGCFVSNAPFVLSDASSPNEALSNAIAVAMAKVDKYNDDRQNAEIDKLPNILDCQNMDWMKNCSELNRNAKKNPQAPMRMIGKNGVEFNFQPGTPSAVINLQLNQTLRRHQSLSLIWIKPGVSTTSPPNSTKWQCGKTET